MRCHNTADTDRSHVRQAVLSLEADVPTEQRSRDQNTEEGNSLKHFRVLIKHGKSQIR